MSTCLLAYPDFVIPTAQTGVTAGGFTPLFSGGGWSHIGALSEPNLDSYATSFTAGSIHTTFDIDLGATRELRVFAIPGNNFTSAATVQVKVGTVASFASGVVLDSGAQSVFPRYYPVGSIPSTHESYADGKLSAEALLKFAIRPGWYYAHSSTVNGRYVRVIISDIANPATYVTLNRFICAPAWQPSINMSYGIMPTWISNDNPVDTLGGVTLFDKRPKKRAFQFSIDSLGSNEAMVYAFEMQRILGIDGELFFVYDPADTDLLLRQRSFLCTLKQMNAIQYPYFGTMSAGFELVEKI
jgi:hypothetical protein